MDIDIENFVEVKMRCELLIIYIAWLEAKHNAFECLTQLTLIY